MRLAVAMLSGLAVVVSLWNRPATAATITNRDAREHKLTILSGASSGARSLKPGDAMRDVCPKGCIVRLGETREGDYEIEGADAVVIEDGQLYYESSDAAPPRLVPSAPERERSK